MTAHWRLASSDAAAAERLAHGAGISPLLAGLLARRGIATPEDARAFLQPDMEDLHDPFSMRGSAEAVDRMVWTAQRGGRIVVFGDYDVDGVTAVAQLRAALARVGADAAAFLPHRLRDGYGLKPRTVRRLLRELRPALLVTVDCGITAVEGVACARAAGVDVIVTDHHLVPDQLPQGAVVVNPKQPGCRYPFKELSGSGIAFKLAEAIGLRSGRPLSRPSLLRLACLGTIADLVPLRGENRVIAAGGLAALSTPRAPGLRAVLVEAGVAPGRSPAADEVAYRLAPRLNAAGRLGSAELALALFEERDPTAAAAIARELSRRNAERQSIERRVVAEARERIARDRDAQGDAVLVEADARWHRGVLGIAASRLAREYHRPVLLFALEGDTASGSGRSIPSVPLYETVKEIASWFLDFGGHDQAIGATLPAARFEEFRAAARDLFARRVRREQLLRVEEAEAELPLESVTPELLFELERLEPHGVGNPRPVFRCGAVRAAGPLLALSEAGVRGSLSRSGADLPWVAWAGRQTLERLACARESFAIHYRIERDRRRGGPRLEILAASAGAAA